MKRVIVHSDINHAYAQIEEMMNPKLRDVPMVVGGSEEKRNGIVLAKNDMARKFNIKTAEPLRDALKKCPNLQILHPNFDAYVYYTEKVKDIYRNYSDRVESFGLDEAWVDLTGTKRLFGDEIQLASHIQEEVYRKLGLTVSMGISFNKVFAKLGSDLWKQKGFVYISEDNYKDIVWPLPVEYLLMVGIKTTEKLHQMNIYTIEQLATCPIERLVRRFGKIGKLLYCFANGLDTSEVKEVGYQREVKSVGNGKTTIRNVEDFEQLHEVFRILSESVAARLRDIHKKGQVISVGLRSDDLTWKTRQRKISYPTNTAKDILNIAMSLAKEVTDTFSYRSVGVSVSDLKEDLRFEQLDLFMNTDSFLKQRKVEEVMERIRDQYGFHSCGLASVQVDKDLTDFDPRGTHTVHPVSFFGG